MVEINYDALELLMQAKQISRRQLAAQIGISPDSFAGSFRRKSKMKVEQVWRIADYFGIEPESILFVDRDGHYIPSDYDLVTSRRAERDSIIENWSIVEITNMLKRMNQDGLNTVQSLVSVLCEVQRFKKNPSVVRTYVSGSDGNLSLEREQYVQDID